MAKKYRVWKNLLMLTMMLLLAAPCIQASAEESSFAEWGIDKDCVVVIYTNDIHGGASDNEQYSGSEKSLGFAGVAAVKEACEKNAAGVALVDVGDAVQGSILCSQSEGADMIEIMNRVGYDFLVAGNHEFDYGRERLEELADLSGAPYLAVNYIDAATGNSILNPYVIVPYELEKETLQVAYLGIMTPENISKGSISNFQDEEGNNIYSFDGENLDAFYSRIQTAIDQAYSEGADCVVAMGHLGNEGITKGWSSEDVIANTSGITAFLDGHSHSVVEEKMCKDAEGKEVPLSSAGTKLEQIGMLVLRVNEGNEVSAKTRLIHQLTNAEKELASYRDVDAFVTQYEENYAYLMVTEGSSGFGLYIYHPETGERMIRSQETNLGDFITDAFRDGLDADVAFSNGGNIRADLEAGEISFLDIMNVLPWSSNIVKLEVSGQQLLDCLEMGARLWPEQCGGFIQTSGLTYSIDTSVTPSVVTTEDGLFERVDGAYRVTDVYVGEEKLNPDKTYTLAVDEYYYLSDGDGMTMFKECKALVGAEKQVIDHDLVVGWLNKLGGKITEEYENPEGQGRIRILNAEEPGEPGADIESEAVQEASGAAEKQPDFMMRAVAAAALLAYLGYAAYWLFWRKRES